MGEAFQIILLATDSAIRLSVPLIFACLAGLFSERAGVVDIGLEGKMLVGAFAAGAVAALAPNPWTGLLAAVAASCVFALVHGFAAITQRGNQIVSGVAVNVLASGLTAILGNAWFAQGGRTPQLPNAARFGEITLPFAEEARAVPVIGAIYAEVVSGIRSWSTSPSRWWRPAGSRSTARAGACACAPSARTRPPSTLPGCR